jgi:RNA polymerase sigma-32 factor
MVACENGHNSQSKKLFFKLRTAKRRTSALEDGDLRPDQVRVIATALAVRERDGIDMNRRLAGDVSPNVTTGVERDSGELQDWLVDDTAGQESRLAESEEADWRHRILRHALAALNERERHIFEQRRLADKPTTFDDLADELGVSRERVRQIEVRAFEKVQKLVKLLDDRRRRLSELSAMEHASATSQWRAGREGMTRRSRARVHLNACPPQRLTAIREAERKRTA